jgi:SRSO17 transposase
VDFELHLPKEWMADKKRMQRAGVPKPHQRGYRTRQENCLALLERCASKLPHTWVTADDEFGRPAGFRRALRERSERYLLAVPCNTTIRDLGSGEPDAPPAPSQRADRWTAEREPKEWTTIRVRDGEKGPISVQAIKTPVETGWPKYDTLAREVFVVIRYQDRDSQVVKTDYYLSNAERDTPLQEFCRAAKAEHRIEECLQRGKSQAGLADYEVRNWIGWHHHQTLSLVAAWFLTVETRRAEKKDAGDHAAPSPPRHRRNPPQGTRMRFPPRRQMAY